MPLYEYQCEACEHRFEVIQKYIDPPIAACPKCGGAVAKLPSSPAIQFKGSGFYITDYARAGKSDGSADGAKDGSGAKDGAKEGGAGTPAAAESKGEGTGGSSAADTSSAAKPETPAAPKPAASEGTSRAPKTSD